MTLEASQSTGPFPSPPRNIAGGYGFRIWVGRFLVTLFMPLGVLAALLLLLVIIWACFHVEVPGHVNGGEITRGAKGRIEHTLNYEYEANGRNYRNQLSVDADAYRNLVPGPTNARTPVTIRHFSAGAIHYSDIKEAESVAGVLLEKFFLCLAVNSLLLFFAWNVWIRPLRTRWLFIHGLTAPATVIDKRSRRHKSSTSFMATIVYEHPVTHDKLQREVVVHKKQDREAAETGQVVTVLCYPQKPLRIAVAEWGPYRIIS